MRETHATMTVTYLQVGQVAAAQLRSMSAVLLHVRTGLPVRILSMATGAHVQMDLGVGIVVEGAIGDTTYLLLTGHRQPPNVKLC